MKKNILLIMAISILLFALVVGTYAYFAVTNSDNTTISGTLSSASLDLTVTKVAGGDILVPQLTQYLGSALKGSCIDANGNTACQVYEISLSNDSDSTANLSGTLILSAGTFKNLKWEVLKSSTELNSSRDTKDSTDTDLVSEVTLDAGDSETYYIAIWIAETGDNQSSLDTGSFTGIVTFESSISSVSVSSSLTGILATKKVKLLATSNPKEVYSISQPATDQTTATTEYRYWGKTPSNYVWFNCDATDLSGNTLNSVDYAYSTTTCEKWRIIGSFETENASGQKAYRVKIIRDESIGSYSWDNSTDVHATGSNNWANARLMKLLNSGYSGTGGSLYYTRSDGYCYSGKSDAVVSCQFSSKGLKTSVTATGAGYISTVKWYLGGQDSSNYADYWWNRQRSTNTYGTNPTSWVGEIGLIYGEDYGYSAGYDCAINPDTRKISSSSDSSLDYRACSSTNWLYSGQWTLSPGTKTATTIGMAHGWGALYLWQNASESYGIHPVLYLEPKVKIVMGTGTSANPYVLGVS